LKLNIYLITRRPTLQILIQSFFLCLLQMSISLFNFQKSLTKSGLWCFVQYPIENLLLYYYYNFRLNFMNLTLTYPSSTTTIILHPSKNLNWKFISLLLVIILRLNNLGNFQMMASINESLSFHVIFVKIFDLECLFIKLFIVAVLVEYVIFLFIFQLLLSDLITYYLDPWINYLDYSIEYHKEYQINYLLINSID
jgi:hypothetical protein